jgi:integrase
MRDAGVPGTPHGFRSAFKDWAAEHGVRDEVSEAALAHADRDKVRAAYSARAWSRSASRSWSGGPRS